MTGSCASTILLRNPNQVLFCLEPSQSLFGEPLGANFYLLICVTGCLALWRSLSLRNGAAFEASQEQRDLSEAWVVGCWQQDLSCNGKVGGPGPPQSLKKVDYTI